VAFDHAYRPEYSFDYFPPDEILERPIEKLPRRLLERKIVMNSHSNGHWPFERLSKLENFGHSLETMAYLYRPTNAGQVADLFEQARARGTSVTLRGSGRSYGDAALNAGGVIIDLRRMNRILEWDPETGIIVMEPGVTIQQLWQHIIEDGWWPPVVPGTMFPTIGGCLGANIHGKNNWQRGTIGEQVLAFTALLPNGEEIQCTPEDEHFYNLISTLGMLGVFTRITMQMKKIYSGEIWVGAWAEPNLAEMLRATDEGKVDNDYIVGWIDCTVGGQNLGRGQMHTANYFVPGEDPAPAQTLNIDYQVLPDTFFGLVPKSILYRFMAPFMNNLGVRATNSAKYFLNQTIGNHKLYRQSLVGFNFLLDYIPNWERAYGPGGMIQYQVFLPKETAEDAFREIIDRGLRHRLPNYLGVLKRHRSDRFLFSHAVDGYSFAQDYRVTTGNRQRLKKLFAELDQVVLDAGGRFYFAKDSTLNATSVRAFLGEETLQQFTALKNQFDPDHLLESDLYRRLLAEPVPGEAA
jgi:FAD/FMN-containing dehydrogenase